MYIELNLDLLASEIKADVTFDASEFISRLLAHHAEALSSHLGRAMCPECHSEDVDEDDLETECNCAVASYHCDHCGCEFHDNLRPVEREITKEGSKDDVD